MNYAPAAPEFERLPWLSDDRKPEPKGGANPLLLWSILAALLIAGASYWIGMTSRTQALAGGERQGIGASSATIALPAPVAAEPQQSAPAMPQVEPVAPPSQVTIARPQRSQRASARPKPRSSARSAAAIAPAVEKKESPQELWPASRSEGAAGRAVRIGAFENRRQAKIGWRRIMQVYPGMNRLQAVVVPSPSLRNGQTYYRLQFGTTSQAHSAVLCQRMRSIGQSCVIIGQPAEAAG